MNKISSKKWVVGDRIITSGNRLGMVSNITKKITITWENGLSGEYTPKQMQAWNYQKFLEEKGAIAECLHNLTSAQESVLASVVQGCNTDLTSSEPQRLTNTAQASLNYDIQELTTTVTCKASLIPEHSDCNPSSSGSLMRETPLAQPLVEKTAPTHQEQSISSQLLPLVPHFPQKDSDSEQLTSVTVSPQSLKLSENCSPNSSPSKTLQDSSPAPINQTQTTSIFHTYSDSLPSAGTMRNGLLSEAATLPVPTLESEYCWLRSPGALSLSGKGRPPGQTKQEAELKKLGLINKGEVLNPVILCQWYEIPDSWLDPSESRAATELLEECDRQQEIFSILESQRSPYNESSTLTPCVENQPLLTRANAKTGTYIIDQSETLGIIKDHWGFGFVVDWFSSQFAYNWERDNQLIGKLAIAPQHLIDKFLEDNHPQLCTRCLKVVDRNYTCDKCPPMQCTQQIQNVHCPSCESPLIKLDNGCGVCGWIPENFLEESNQSAGLKQSSKRRQHKGCLYKYIENKKLKNGTIASYPRVIGHREQGNPTHWRWGYNWEEKVDGEWKGRSIGSVPLGAITLIQSMQNEGVSLEEIIGFIKRAKSKKGQ